MKVSRPNEKAPTTEETQELARIKGLIEKAIADGRVTYQEFENIQKAALGSGNVSADQLYRELELYRTLVTERIAKGELEYDG